MFKVDAGSVVQGKVLKSVWCEYKPGGNFVMSYGWIRTVCICK
jgi:hypothetical protein